MKLTHKQLPVLFKGIRYSKEGSDYMVETYVLNQNGIDVLAIHYIGTNEWRFLKDNFPFDRRLYYTNFPITTTERFIAEMKHIGIHLELK